MPEPLDPKIEALDLAPAAKRAAYLLKAAHPPIEFASGRRALADQARAMSKNVAKNRQWIAQTYSKTEVSTACQAWVDQNPTAVSSEDIAAGLADLLQTFAPEQLVKLSRHLDGNAFDVRPVLDDAAADAIKTTIRALPGLDKFLDKEGGLIIWHAQFK